jgi:hypothetical protein
VGGGSRARRDEVIREASGGAEGRRRAVALIWSWIQQGKVDTEAEFRALIDAVGLTPPPPTSSPGT